MANWLVLVTATATSKHILVYVSTDSIHGVSFCITTAGRMTGCRTFSFTRASRERMSGLQVKSPAQLASLGVCGTLINPECYARVAFLWNMLCVALKCCQPSSAFLPSFVFPFPQIGKFADEATLDVLRVPLVLRSGKIHDLFPHIWKIPFVLKGHWKTDSYAIVTFTKVTELKSLPQLMPTMVDAVCHINCKQKDHQAW